jgi:hypothetical protein
MLSLKTAEIYIKLKGMGNSMNKNMVVVLEETTASIFSKYVCMKVWEGDRRKIIPGRITSSLITGFKIQKN